MIAAALPLVGWILFLLAVALVYRVRAVGIQQCAQRTRQHEVVLEQLRARVQGMEHRLTLAEAGRTFAQASELACRRLLIATALEYPGVSVGDDSLALAGGLHLRVLATRMDGRIHLRVDGMAAAARSLGTH